MQLRYVRRYFNLDKVRLSRNFGSEKHFFAGGGEGVIKGRRGLYSQVSALLIVSTKSRPVPLRWSQDSPWREHIGKGGRPYEQGPRNRSARPKALAA